LLLPDGQPVTVFVLITLHSIYLFRYFHQYCR